MTMEELEYDLPLAKRFLNAIETYGIAGLPPDPALSDAFDALYPPSTLSSEESFGSRLPQKWSYIDDGGGD
jgi:hypothetical protein